MPAPDQPVHWVDQAGNQVGPEPFGILMQRVRGGQVPPSTAVWWDGAPEWMRFDQIPPVAEWAPEADPIPAAAPEPEPEPVADPEPEPEPEPELEPEPVADPVPQLLLQGISEGDLDDEFVALFARSWEMYKETELATSIDETMLGGVITAMVDSGFLLIDLTTSGAPVGLGGPAVVAATDVGAAGSGHHELRFEEPTTAARVIVALRHLTADPAAARVIGHRASAVIGYGERVPNFGQVGQAVRQEVASAFIASPEPGTVTFDADMSSGYVFAQVDLLLELSRYVSDDLVIDHELLRRHLASVVYTMQTFVRARFAT